MLTYKQSQAVTNIVQSATRVNGIKMSRPDNGVKGMSNLITNNI